MAPYPLDVQEPRPVPCRRFEARASVLYRWGIGDDPIHCPAPRAQSRPTRTFTLSGRLPDLDSTLPLFLGKNRYCRKRLAKADYWARIAGNPGKNGLWGIRLGSFDKARGHWFESSIAHFENPVDRRCQRGFSFDRTSTYVERSGVFSVLVSPCHFDRDGPRIARIVRSCKRRSENGALGGPGGRPKSGALMT
jgi:hypothetical protein